MSLKFNQKTAWSSKIILKITPTVDKFTLQSTMQNLHFNFMSWKKLIQKPNGNVLTEAFRITVSRSLNVIHEPQCKNQMNEEMKMSLSVVVIFKIRS